MQERQAKIVLPGKTQCLAHRQNIYIEREGGDMEGGTEGDIYGGKECERYGGK